jgi:hypothetical protein
VIAVSLVLAGSVLVGLQPPAPSKPERNIEPIPAEFAVDALVAAYSTRPVADEVRVKVRLPGDIERTEFYVIRIKPGATPESGPERFFLDFGRLKVVGADGVLTAVSAATPGKYARREVQGPLGAESLIGFIPPIAVPQLVLASGTAAAFATPTPFTSGVKWTSAVADESVRPAVVTISGAGAAGTVTVTVNAETGRLVSLRAVMPGRAGDTVLDMAMRSVEPGDPALWMLRTADRTLVPSVSDLRPSLVPRPSVIDGLTATRADGTAWTPLHSLPAGGARPLVLVLVRDSDDEPQGGSRFEDGRRGLAAASSVFRGSPDADPPGAPVDLAIGVLIVMEPAMFKPERFEQSEKRWSSVIEAADPSERPMWTTGGAAILESSGAVIVVVNPDRTLRAVVGLDGRTDPASIAEELRAAIAEPAKKETAAPETPR